MTKCMIYDQIKKIMWEVILPHLTLLIDFLQLIDTKYAQTFAENKLQIWLNLFFSG